MKVVILSCTLLLSNLFVVSAQNVDEVRDSTQDSGRIRNERIWRCYPLFEDSKIGLTYGVLNMTPGIKVYDFTYSVIGIPLNLITDLEWRVPRKGNGYFNLEFTRNIARCGVTYIAPSVGYKRVLSNATKVTNQFSGGVNLLYWNSVILVGYARQYHKQSESQLTIDNGLMVRVYKEFFNHVDITLASTYWFDQFQYSIQINENIFGSGVIVGFGYEKISEWNEFDICVMYRYR